MKIQFRTYAVEHWHYTKSAHVGYVFFFPAMLYIFMPARIKHQKKAFFIVYGGKKTWNAVKLTSCIGHVTISTQLQKVKYIIQNPTDGDHRGHTIKNSSCQKKLFKTTQPFRLYGKTGRPCFLTDKGHTCLILID